MVVAMASKVPQVHGKSDEVMSALMERMPSAFVYGDEKFCIIRYLPGLFGLGMMDRGDVWNGPRMFSICCWEKGPSYLPLLNSCSTDFWNVSWYIEILSLLRGVNVRSMYLIAALKPYCRLMGMCLYLLIRLLDCSMECHSLAWYGVLVRNSGLCEPTGLSSVVTVSTARASVPREVQVGVAGPGEVPVQAQ